MVLTTLTIQQLTAFLNNLYGALGNPTEEVRRPDGTMIRFRTVAEIRKAIAEVEDTIRSMGSEKTSKSTLAQHKRGDGPDPAALPWWEHW
jgi:hypothetical protein